MTPGAVIDFGLDITVAKNIKNPTTAGKKIDLTMIV
jgi:hypothetical protein